MPWEHGQLARAVLDLSLGLEVSVAVAGGDALVHLSARGAGIFRLVSTALAVARLALGAGCGQTMDVGWVGDEAGLHAGEDDRALARGVDDQQGLGGLLLSLGGAQRG